MNLGVGSFLVAVHMPLPPNLIIVPTPLQRYTQLQSYGRRNFVSGTPSHAYTHTHTYEYTLAPRVNTPQMVFISDTIFQKRVRPILTKADFLKKKSNRIPTDRIQSKK